MGKKLDQKEAVSFEELLISNTIEQEALINILERKGLINKKELLEEINSIRKQQSR